MVSSISGWRRAALAGAADWAARSVGPGSRAEWIVIIFADAFGWWWEAEPGWGRVLRHRRPGLARAIDYPDVELDFYDLTGSEDTARGSVKCLPDQELMPLPLAGPLFRICAIPNFPTTSPT